MRKLKVVVSGWVLGMLLAAPALADIPPPDACMQADEGKACDNAGQNADQPGVCKQSSCTRQTPDGPMTYDCHLCQAANGGTSGAAGATGNGGSTAAGGTTSRSNDDDGGCSMSAAPVGGLAALIGPLAAFGLAVARRRRSRR